MTPQARKPSSPSPTPAVVNRNEVYSLCELRRRLQWQEHAVRQARLAGLRFVIFGRQKFVLGSDVIDFFQRLAEQQEAVSDCHLDGGEGE